jgi:succinate dehydrogenase/fumarate reductase-like Fe-S protein
MDPPSVRILVTGLDLLPEVIYLLTSDRKRLEQRVEYVGLPNQCFVCKHIGHLARECPTRIPTQEQINSKQTRNMNTSEQWVYVGKHGKKVQEQT